MNEYEKDINKLANQLKEIDGNEPSRDPSTMLTKKLGVTQGNILLILIRTLNKSDATNTALGETNIRLQRAVIALSVITLVATIVSVIATFIA